MGDVVGAEVDAERRARTMRNHTGTHLLHRALRNVVGERARQAGSLVTPDYLRFDFPFDRGLTDDETRAIEDEVRRIIREDRPVTVAPDGMREAIDAGADAFFDEKYGETVRTIRVEGYSFELCGGTHCRATGQIGGFLITGERSIGSGCAGSRRSPATGPTPSRREPVACSTRRGQRRRRDGGRRPPDRVAALQEELKEARRRPEGRRRQRDAEAGRAGRPGHTGRAGVSRRHIRRSVRVDRGDEGSCPGRARPAAQRGHRARARRRRAAGLRDRQRRPRSRRASRPATSSSGRWPGSTGRGGGRPEMAQGKGTRRDGLAAALDEVREAAGVGGAG